MILLLMITASLMLLVFVFFVLSPVLSPKKLALEGKHVLITGGSLGIGKALAIKAAEKGAHLTLLARNKVRLEAAKAEVEQQKKNENQKVFTVSVDLAAGFPAVENAVKQAVEENGAVDVLVNCAGMAITGYFEEMPIEDHQKMMNLNYFGALYASRAVLPTMKKQQAGRIVFVSSMAGQIGLFGYHGYCASKFALRGLAEALQMEVKPHNIYITLAFPPDTDTPGYAQENIGKPRETMLISETAGLIQPEVVASGILASVEKGEFNCSIGIDGLFLSTVTAGMSPVTSLMDAVQQVLLMGVFRAAALFYLHSFNRIVKKCKQEREQR